MKHVIEMEWWTEEDKSEPKQEHQEALVETAMEQVPAMVVDGYREGEMADNILMVGDDGEEGISYRGYWKISEVTEEEVAQ